MSPGAYFDFAIGSKTWPGLSKLIEECGEVIQVAGKLIATGGETEHWDGTDLADRFTEEVGDVLAAIYFMEERMPDPMVRAIHARTTEKLNIFRRWHVESVGLNGEDGK